VGKGSPVKGDVFCQKGGGISGGGISRRGRVKSPSVEKGIPVGRRNRPPMARDSMGASGDPRREIVGKTLKKSQSKNAYFDHASGEGVEGMERIYVFLYLGLRKVFWYNVRDQVQR